MERIESGLGGNAVGRFSIRRSYRATYELTRFANRVLSRQPGAVKAKPYGDRHGEKPFGIRSKSYTDMVMAIVKDIEKLRAAGRNTIGVLCKTDKEARFLLKKMIRQGAVESVCWRNGQVVGL